MVTSRSPEECAATCVDEVAPWSFNGPARFCGGLPTWEARQEFREATTGGVPGGDDWRHPHEPAAPEGTWPVIGASGGCQTGFRPMTSRMTGLSI